MAMKVLNWYIVFISTALSLHGLKKAIVHESETDRVGCFATVIAVFLPILGFAIKQLLK